MGFQELPRYKVALIGDGGVGKTTFIKRNLTGEFLENYIPTMGVEPHGGILFDIWNISSDQSSTNSRAEYLRNSDAAIIMFDFSRRITYDNVINWHQLMLNNSGPIPIILLGNKADIDEQDREVKVSETMSRPIENAEYYDISTKSAKGFDEPFLSLCRHFFKDPSLEFLTCCGIPVPDPEKWEQLSKEWETAMKNPLPDVDSDE
ncbi:hypothetical protein AJ80_03954 [Polytolypa hystricis UAMH7299]|uniref:GTP-binding nuclear protein n=1 Tax=Polytolypa hystricis (strain UAMH7299) TaxID=1447883 RepID=A0A2B7YEJ1_POLH7|nr:hypothetical protein AJ80_03954 [Polytolypa hystricis UAMH7299]